VIFPAAKRRISQVSKEKIELNNVERTLDPYFVEKNTKIT